MTKKCSMCNQTFTDVEDSFYKDIARKDGYQHYCKKRHNQHTMGWAKRNPYKSKRINTDAMAKRESSGKLNSSSAIQSTQRFVSAIERRIALETSEDNFNYARYREIAQYSK